MNTPKQYRHARLADNYKHLYDADGKKVTYDDPRVVHIWQRTKSETTTRLMGAAFNKRKWRFRYNGLIGPDELQYARRLCSGRECLPLVALTGGVYKDMQTRREKGEISIYYTLNQDGPCQNGGWAAIFDTYLERLKDENTIFMAHTSINDNFMGQGDLFAAAISISIILGDISDEVESVIKCLARDKEEALVIFRKHTDLLIESIPKGYWALKKALGQWIKALKDIPLKGSLQTTPKVLLFGGLNTMFIQKPIAEFFEERGIITKVIDFSEGINWLTSEHVVRYGIERGMMTPDAHYSLKTFFSSFWKLKGGLSFVIKASRAWLHVWWVDTMIRFFRWHMGKTGLLYDIHAPFPEISRAGHPYASTNGFNETSITVGRYLCTVNEGVFDGLVNIGSYNCQAARNAQAILQSLSGSHDMPYVPIDCEGPWLSAGQERLLETLAVQAKRHCERKDA